MVVIKNGRVMDPKTGLDQVCDLRIEGKKIVEIAENLPTDGQEVLDATGLVVAPGLIEYTSISVSPVKLIKKTSIRVP